MAASNLNEYVQKVAVALDEREGVKCAELLSFSHSHIANARLRVEAPEAVCSRFMAQPFDEMVAAHIKVIINVIFSMNTAKFGFFQFSCNHASYSTAHMGNTVWDLQ